MWKKAIYSIPEYYFLKKNETKQNKQKKKPEGWSKHIRRKAKAELDKLAIWLQRIWAVYVPDNYEAIFGCSVFEL